MLEVGRNGEYVLIRDVPFVMIMIVGLDMVRKAGIRGRARGCGEEWND